MTSSKEKPQQLQYQEFGNLFKETRVEFALSTEDLAQMADVGHDTLLQIESNPHLVSLHDLYAVANCLNLDPGSVLEFLHASVVKGGKA